MGVMGALTGDHEQSFSRLVRLSGHGDDFKSAEDPKISFKHCSSVTASTVHGHCDPYPLQWDCAFVVVGCGVVRRL